MPLSVVALPCGFSTCTLRGTASLFPSLMCACAVLVPGGQARRYTSVAPARSLVGSLLPSDSAVGPIARCRHGQGRAERGQYRQAHPKKESVHVHVPTSCLGGICGEHQRRYGLCLPGRRYVRRNTVPAAANGHNCVRESLSALSSPRDAKKVQLLPTPPKAQQQCARPLACDGAHAVLSGEDPRRRSGRSVGVVPIAAETAAAPSAAARASWTRRSAWAAVRAAWWDGALTYRLAPAPAAPARGDRGGDRGSGADRGARVASCREQLTR